MSGAGTGVHDRDVSWGCHLLSGKPSACGRYWSVPTTWRLACPSVHEPQGNHWTNGQDICEPALEVLLHCGLQVFWVLWPAAIQVGGGHTKVGMPEGKDQWVRLENWLLWDIRDPCLTPSSAAQELSKLFHFRVPASSQISKMEILIPPESPITSSK